MHVFLSGCMCVCMYKHTYACMHGFMCLGCLDEDTATRPDSELWVVKLNEVMHACMRVCMYVCVCVYVCMYVCMYVHTHTCMHK